jgi:hypothetical protein
MGLVQQLLEIDVLIPVRLASVAAKAEGRSPRAEGSVQQGIAILAVYQSPDGS